MYILVQSQRATARTLQNVSEVNRERSRLAAASGVCDWTKRPVFEWLSCDLTDHPKSRPFGNLTTLYHLNTGPVIQIPTV